MSLQGCTLLCNVGCCIDVDAVYAEACAGITRSQMAACAEFYAFSCASADREVNMEMEREGGEMPEVISAGDKPVYS